jgi:hypothetical protein
MYLPIASSRDWQISVPKIAIGCILEGHEMGIVGKFYGHLVNFMAIWCILRPFGVFNDHLVYTYNGHLVYLMAIWCI